jgi:hypothetical protein
MRTPEQSEELDLTSRESRPCWLADDEETMLDARDALAMLWSTSSRPGPARDPEDEEASG